MAPKSGTISLISQSQLLGINTERRDQALAARSRESRLKGAEEHRRVRVEEKIMPFPLRKEDLLIYGIQLGESDGDYAVYSLRSTEVASPNRCADVERSQTRCRVKRPATA